MATVSTVSKAVFQLLQAEIKCSYSIYEQSTNFPNGLSKTSFHQYRLRFLWSHVHYTATFKMGLSVCLYGNTTAGFQLIESLDTDSFINALQRFINRRGKPDTLVSNCGSNFKDATRELNLEHPELNQDKIINFTDQQNVK